MARIEWDKINERTYQNGLDRGVLYSQDGSAVPWNGLVAMEESSVSELKAYYLDGVKFLENLAPGEFQGKLKAITYPDEFDQVTGLAIVAPGLIVTEQQPKSFNLSYRTLVGNPIEGTDYGYKIHILYNLLANPDTRTYQTLAGADQPMEFVWNLTGTPPKINKFRPTVHLVIDSRTTPVDIMALLEDRLYGSETMPPNLPTITEVGEYFGYLGALIVIDNGDGTWTALDESDTYITMTNDTTFEIIGVDAVYLDSDTYTISSTNVGGGF
jgi:hypothetical protein